MNADKIKELETRFPVLMGSRLRRMFGSETGEGWDDLIVAAVEGVDGIAQKHGLTEDNYPQITCIKEKFGLLRIYCDFKGEVPKDCAEAIYNLLDEIETQSGNVCEFCGASPASPKTKPNGHWIRTVCEKGHEYDQPAPDFFMTYVRR